MKEEFFTALEALDPNVESYSLTCLSPEHLGEKAIWAGGEWFYRDISNGYPQAKLALNPLDSACGYPWDCKYPLDSACKYPWDALAASVSEHALNPLDMGCGIFSLAGESFYVERLGHEKKLIICGAGHVSIAIIKIAKLLALHVTCIDDRPLFADHARAAGADQVICEEFETALSRLTGDSDSYFVIVTRGHQYDRDCLRAIAGKKHAYIGLMGSRRRVQLVKEGLRQEGVSGEVLDSVHTPIGLAIGAETPEEIAVSVMAEIIEVKNGAQRNVGIPEEILRAVIGGHHREKEAGDKVLCTIVRRKGSAPRQVGTKMLLLSDGRCIGTIGGGCIEAEVVRRGREMLAAAEDEERRNSVNHLVNPDANPVDHLGHSDRIHLEPEALDELASGKHASSMHVRLFRGLPDANLFTVDLTAEMASDEGMVCGGKVEVLLERIPAASAAAAEGQMSAKAQDTAQREDLS